MIGNADRNALGIDFIIMIIIVEQNLIAGAGSGNEIPVAVRNPLISQLVEEGKGRDRTVF
ncbi:hypothetical protein D3C73_1605010 [compost metagenome]